MDLEKARQAVIETGIKLVENGLIARTWGNVSCRIGPDRFIITPSGRSYRSLSPADIVTVDLEDCSYQGEVEPSSEMGVHAEVYRQRADVNFVIHTHQPCASAVSAMGDDLDLSAVGPSAEGTLGDKICAVTYALPGSRDLRENVALALQRSRGKAFLISGHGALCLGADSHEAFSFALSLEKACLAYIKAKYLERYRGKGAERAMEVDCEQIRACFVREHSPVRPGFHGQGEGNDKTPFLPRYVFFNSARERGGIKLYPEGKPGAPFPDRGAEILPPGLPEKDFAPPPSGSAISESFPWRCRRAAQVHRSIYGAYNEVGAIIHAITPDIVAVSRTGRDLPPLLDDFAQIIGTKAPAAPDTGDIHDLTGAVVGRLRDCNAVLVRDSGAICCGPRKSDAEAAALILDKNCKAFITASLLGEAKPIDPEECAFMRSNYLNRYSRKDTW